MRSDAEMLAEQIEAERGNPALMREILIRTIHNSEIESGNRFWHSKFYELLDRGIEVTPELAHQTFHKPGRLDTLLIPRSLHWAIETAKNINEDCRKLLDSHKVSFTSIPAFNAMAAKKDEATVILINLPLIFGLQALNSCAFRILDLEESSVLRLIPSSLWIGKKKRAIKDLWFEYNSWTAWIANPDPKADIFSKITTEEYIPGMSLVNLQILFVLLHELAHFKLGHLDQPSDYVVESDRVAFAMNQSQAREFAADDLAQQWLMELGRGFSMNGFKVGKDTAPKLCATAIAHFFCSLALIESLSSMYAPSLPEIDTHPLPFIRYAKLGVELKHKHQRPDLVDLQTEIISSIGRLT